SAAGFGITSLGVYALSPSFAMFGTATLVVSAMLATALIVSSLVFAMVARGGFTLVSSIAQVFRALYTLRAILSPSSISRLVNGVLPSLFRQYERMKVLKLSG
ncbi:MAG: hypothetical protein O7B30_00220, partial [Thaumarchaeota archaeon]|nr:hypothetical protein [Nitrososphaerota archaeon]